MSPDKQAVGSPSPAPTHTPDHHSLTHPSTSSHSSDSSSNGSNCSTSGAGTSLSNSRSPSDRNNNLHSNHNNNNNNSSTGSVSQSNAILHLTPHSVIQAANQQSVIISTTAAAGVAQLISSRNELEAKVLDEESKKRREVLERRPSYRKILNDLSSAEVSQIVSQFQQPDIKSDPDHHTHHHPQQHSPNNSNNSTSVVTSGANNNNNNTSGSNNSSQQSVQSAPTTHQQATITVAASPYLKVVPASTIQLAGPSAGSPTDGLPGISALAVNTGSATAAGTIVQYHGQDGQPFFVPVSPHYPNGGHSFNSPVTVSAADLHSYQLGHRGAGHGSNSQQLTSGVMMASPNMSGHVPGEVQEVSKKRELRLLKNREAAKECRRKKKEYIKCLENRVAVLENQNKALIDELKSLKELYCSNKND